VFKDDIQHVLTAIHLEAYIIHISLMPSIIGCIDPKVVINI